ncbi:MAG: hypothetical protein IJ829_07810, partial [Kiritimatiellae bacterium]|nr:hypothetical protein [Kiritimatiellia bacterium]
DDGGDDIDDLFDDNPKPKKKPAKAAAKSAPRPPAPGVAEATVVFDGEFRHNVRTKTMLKKLNKARTDLEVILRKGGCCFFSPRYSTVRADRGPADIFLGAIPQVMKDNTVFEAFSAGARSRGVTFLPDAVMRDLFRNRLDYIRLMDRAKSVKDERKWESMLNSGR